MKQRQIKLLLVILPLTVFFMRCTQTRETQDDRHVFKRGPGIALFYAAGFPAVDAPQVPLKHLELALEGLSHQVLSSPEDFSSLSISRFTLLVLPYGSAFPLQAWPRIYDFIKNGGSLLVLGGAPFHQPVRRDRDTGKWILGIRQPTFAHALLVGPAEPLSIPPGCRDRLNIKLCSGFDIDTKELSSLHPSKTYALTVRFAKEKEYPDEDGSSGPYLARLRPLIHLSDDKDLPLYCPLLEIDRLQGSEAGARWVFAPFDARVSPVFMRACVQRALQGAVSLEAFPSHASIEQAEIPRMRILLRRFYSGADDKVPPTAVMVVMNEAKEKIFTKKIQLQGKSPLWMGSAAIRTKNSLKPGLYRVEISIPGASWQPSRVDTGFWVKDEKLLRAGPRLTVSRDWFRLDGKVFPIIGTTYMAADQHRKFLFDPNPLLWDEDFRQMSRLGINFVRTGIWTGWRRIMNAAGSMDEGAQRSLDAFVQCAARHNIMVCFTFFAFLPPAFGGTNPYLDPISLAGQQAFITSIARRYRGVHWLHYDLINEPSYARPEDLWQTRPVADDFEKRAWKEWLSKRHGREPAEILNRWQAAQAPYSLPKGEDFSYARIKDQHHPRQALDFILFSQDIFRGWAEHLKKTIKKSAGNVLVTVGQDEGGTELRPGQQFFESALDYTSIHTWWFNNDLLWDGITTRVPEKPNLISETGLMRLEDIIGMPWRNPDQASALLERKFAYAFAARGAGAVQWIWNINPYQPLDNEAVIGSFRVDGTAKPELRVLQEYADFFNKAAPYLDDFEPEEVFIILPLSRLFAGRPLGLDAAKKLVRVLADHFAIFPTAISEYALTGERIDKAKLLILPVPGMLTDRVAAVLLKAAREGKKLLITGPLEGTPYGEITASLEKLGASYPCPAISLHEQTGGGEWVTFDKGISQFLRKGTVSTASFKTTNIWYEPLPLEFADQKEPLLALLKKALTNAGIAAGFSEIPLACRLLYAPAAILGICINETSHRLQKTFYFKKQRLSLTIEPGRSRLFLIRRSNGELLLLH